VQAGVLSGEVGNIVLLDVTPLSLGVETLGGVMTKLIPRNTTLPTTKSETFSTAADSQTSVDVHVLQGEREFATDNKSLGTFKLEGIPPAPRGVPQIEVSFNISADGILRVSARDKASGKRADISITGASTLSKDDVAKATADAERYAEADRKRRELVDARNEAESALYQAGRQVKEFKEKVPADVTDKVQARIDELGRAAGGDDVAAIKKASEALREAVSAIGQSVYSQQQQQPGAQQPGGAQPGGGSGSDGGPASPGGPGVIDAEFSDSE
jgi:molecular chaperone DnaK